MNRVIDDPEEVAEGFIHGALLARPDLLAATDHPRVVCAAGPGAARVAVVTGGGSGHEPAFVGYVGPGLCDAVAIGEIFASPTAKSFHGAFKAADRGQGVACLYGNYAGDNMNVKMAVKLAAKDGIAVKTVVANDDVASASPTEPQNRRGVAGEILMWKVGSARAAEGGTLDEVVAAAQQALDNTRSIGIGLSACTIPANGKPNFSIADGSMEVGIGHHGEPGVAVLPTAPRRRDGEADGRSDRRGPAVPERRPCDGADLGAGRDAADGALPALRARRRPPARARHHAGAPARRQLLHLARDERRLADADADGRGVGAADGRTLHVDRAHADGGLVMDSVDLKAAGSIVLDLVVVIVREKDRLSEIDGATGDGDHGVNMGKGFRLAGEKLARLGAFDLPTGFATLGDTLLGDIGGSMGPLYGTFFTDMAATLAGTDTFDRDRFAAMLHAGLDAVCGLGDAKPGDKTLVDVLQPAVEAFEAAAAQGQDFAGCLHTTKSAAAEGLEATRGMVARLGRAARLGERSRGHLDAGAASCDLILRTLADGLLARLDGTA